MAFSTPAQKPRGAASTTLSTFTTSSLVTRFWPGTLGWMRVGRPIFPPSPLDSPAAGADLAVGDELVSVNGREPTDIIEYQQLIDGEVVTLLDPARRRGPARAR